MTLTTEQKAKAARQLAKEIFAENNITAHSNLDDLIAAINSIDTAMDTVVSTIPAGQQSKTVKQLLVDNLPEPFKSASTANEKVFVLELWARVEVGLI